MKPGKFDYKLKVEALCVGRAGGGVLKTHTDAIRVELDGISGDRHRGFSKPADGRDKGVSRGTPVRNWRQWSAVSVEELALISERLGVGAIDPALLGANITFSGMNGFTALPRGSQIWFPEGAVLTVESENAPCVGPGKEIARVFSEVEPGDFPKVAQKLRGLVGVVYKAGAIKAGDIALVVLVPTCVERRTVESTTHEEFPTI